MAPVAADAGDGNTPPPPTLVSELTWRRAAGETSNPPPQARVRRRARKRDGPPQFQFLTATDPSQFKDETAKRSVRSQAMIQYRYKADQQKRKGKESHEVLPVERLPLAERITPVVTHAEPYQGQESALMHHALSEQQEQEHLYPSTSAAWWGTNPPDEGFGEPSWFPDSSSHLPALQSSRYRQALAAVPLNTAAQKVHDYVESDVHEERQMRILVATLAKYNPIGDGVDPFLVIPQFKSPELSSIYLVRKCNRAFVSEATMVRWLPSMLAHPHILLSSTILASTWLDMHAGCSGDSKRTTLVKAETIGWINERLRDPIMQYEDFTLMVILHLLAGEMWSCNEKTLRIHQTGVARLIIQRGGMDSLGGNNAMAEVSAAVCQHCDIFCEATSLPLFHDWEPPTFGPVEPNIAIPESPIFCPRIELYTILQDPKCSEWTFDVLSDMRDLTDLFIGAHESMNIVQDIDEAIDVSRLSPSLSQFESKLAEIRSRLASLPSAYTPGHPITDDWVYESCRIAAIIYTSAIILRVPFSVAAEPGRSPILAEIASNTNSVAGGHLLTTPLSEALYEVLEKTNQNDIWGSMSGVLYWVALVGSAAARSPTSLNMSHAPRSRSEAYAAWVRRCLIMFATRCQILLVFSHPLPIIYAQKRLLRVQELIGSGSSRRLVS
ncbi:hypothetical protein BDV96DRAFT_487720 [Lophiotrema nucula]|uniref:Uncharacterized protein n=1 Tax=Lophiotrema nucula TaxID=690887 RepID=A0A6A5ZGW8_9PLEO|nr:hypothetical protein BDV96DRAFT_487720 [Lophiotrema nucula]